MPPRVLRRVAFSLHRRHAPSVPGPGALARRRGHLCLAVGDCSSTVATKRADWRRYVGIALDCRAALPRQRNQVNRKSPRLTTRISSGLISNFGDSLSVGPAGTVVTT